MDPSWLSTANFCYDSFSLRSRQTVNHSSRLITTPSITLLPFTTDRGILYISTYLHVYMNPCFQRVPQCTAIGTNVVSGAFLVISLNINSTNGFLCIQFELETSVAHRALWPSENLSIRYQAIMEIHNDKSLMQWKCFVTVMALSMYWCGNEQENIIHAFNMMSYLSNCNPTMTLAQFHI